MIQPIFSDEMIREHEKQLTLALADSAGECYDINFTKNIILGTPVQIVDGVTYSMYEQIGMEKNSSFTGFIEYWMQKIATDEAEAFKKFFDIENIKRRYKNGERLIQHRYWTKDVCGNPMLAIQKIRLYEDVTTGDLLGLTYVSDDKEQEMMIQKAALLMKQNKQISDKVEFLESIGLDIPGGYHRCSTEDGFKLQFVSNSFVDIVGWSREEITNELDNNFINIVAPEDREFFMSNEAALIRDGRIDIAYRICRKDGTRRWVQDATIRTEQFGEVFYQCTLADITDYVEKLNEEKKRAEASSLAKSTFLFNASHDIRTPMNAIQGFTRIIEENVDNPEIVREAARKIAQSGNMLMTLINDVLEISRIERGKDTVEEQALDMDTHVQKLYEMFAEEMENAGIAFLVENDLQHIHILGDELKLTRIAMNLLSNAKKFTSRGGRVTVGVKESDYDGESATYTLFVQDTGIGMSQEFQQRAFEQFERERTSTESGIVGSGLGLAIIKKLSDLMNGECVIDSELGKGTTITVSIPLRINRNETLDQAVKTDYKCFIGKRILLVEDNEFNREIARYTLEKSKFIVDEVENGSECVNRLLKAEPGTYDVVLMDIQMPVMDGYTATKEIRNISNPLVANIPIIAMTANAFEEDKKKCLSVGMDGHLGKPLEVEKVLAELRRFCCKSK